MAGNCNCDIAETFFISKDILQKLGANNRTQAVAISVRQGIFSSSSLFAQVSVHERILQEGGMNELFIKRKPSQAYREGTSHA
jgi:hypothetical protein